MNKPYLLILMCALLTLSCQKKYQEVELVIDVVASPTIEPTTVAPAQPAPLATSNVLAQNKTENKPTPKTINEKINPKVLMGEMWVQIQFLIDKKNISLEDLPSLGSDIKLLDQGITHLDPVIWIPKFEKIRKDVDTFDFSPAFVVKRYEKILRILLSSNVAADRISEYQDRLQSEMSNLEEKSLVDVNQKLNAIEQEIKSLSQTR